MKEAALRYIRQGLPIFPLVPHGKAPATKHGYKDASADPNMVHQWWDENPNYNIGMPVSNWIVMDVDARSGGWETFDALVAEHGDHWISNTMQATGGGGSHFFYRATTKNLTKLQGIDWKYPGAGYVVVEPSIHANGCVYRWGVGSNLNNTPDIPHFLVAPEIQFTLTEHSFGSRYVRAAVASELETLRSTTAGNRNNQLNVSAFKLARFIKTDEIDPVELGETLLKAALDIGLDYKESVATIRSGLTKGVAQ